MDGASNNWIAKKAINILQKIKPQHMVLHWSYDNRRESTPEEFIKLNWKKFYQVIKDTSWPSCTTVSDINQLPTAIKQEILNWPDWPSEEDLRIYCYPEDSDNDNLINAINCINQVEQASGTTQIIHSFIPEFSLKSQQIQQNLNQQHINYIPPFSKLDLARDGHHYDIKTSQVFVNQIIAQIDAQILFEL
jgi:hypothetical protein